MTADPEAPVLGPLRVPPAQTRHRPALHGWRPHGRKYMIVALLVGLVLTLAFAFRVARKPGVYWSDVQARFLLPASSANPNALLVSTGGLIAVAGVVGKMVDDRASTARVVSPDVTIADQGIREGYAVTLPNDGGQWVNNFDKPLLDVQAVGPTVAGVSATMSRLLANIEANLIKLQDDANVAPRNRITISLNPATPQIYYFDGRRSRAVLAALAVGFGLTAAAAWFPMYWDARRRHAVKAASSS